MALEASLCPAELALRAFELCRLVNVFNMSVKGHKADALLGAQVAWNLLLVGDRSTLSFEGDASTMHTLHVSVKRLFVHFLVTHVTTNALHPMYIVHVLLEVVLVGVTLLTEAAVDAFELDVEGVCRGVSVTELYFAKGLYTILTHL